jgi:hypothetical protein
MAKKTSSGSAVGETERPYQVFISHATTDKWLAKVLCEKIEESGATTFRDDRDIKGGDDIPEEIRRQIKQSKEVLVLLTPESANRPWILLEIGAAWGSSRKKKISVILCHVSIDPVPEILKSQKAYTLNEFDRYLEELRGRIGG